MTGEDFEGIVRRAVAALRVDDQVTLVGTGVAPDAGTMTAELRVAGVAGGSGGAGGSAGGTGGSGSSAGGSGGGAGGSGSSAAGGGLVKISVAAADDVGRMESETRAELRRALRMCPLCDRIGHVEKLRGATGQQEGCVVRCPACGDYEIDQELVRRFRSARERHDAAILDRLPSLSERTRTGSPGGSQVRITTGNWRGDAS